MNEEWDDERMDIIGQNGNDGLHYEAAKQAFLKLNYFPPSKETHGGYNLNKDGNIELEFNVLEDGETWMGGDTAYFRKAEFKVDGEAFDSLENGYIPNDGDGCCESCGEWQEGENG